MDRDMKLSSEGPNDMQYMILDVTIKRALELQGGFGSVKDLLHHLRKERVPEEVLVYRDAVFELYLKHSSPRLRNDGRPPTPDPSESKMADSKKSPDSSSEHLTKGAESVCHEDAEDCITFDDKEEQFNLYLWRGSGAQPGWAPFITRICQQKTNFIADSSAKRLRINSTLGAKTKLDWEANRDSMRSKTRRSTFTVVSANSMEYNVALGTDWAIEEDEEAETNAAPAHTPLPAEEVEHWVLGQHQHDPESSTPMHGFSHAEQYHTRTPHNATENEIKASCASAIENIALQSIHTANQSIHALSGLGHSSCSTGTNSHYSIPRNHISSRTIPHTSRQSERFRGAGTTHSPGPIR
jgi:hypothetical protein